VPDVPIGFPFKLDDEQLDRAIADMLEPGNWPGFDDFAKLGPHLKPALLAAGSENGNSATRLSPPREPFAWRTRRSSSRSSRSSSR